MTTLMARVPNSFAYQILCVSKAEGDVQDAMSELMDNGIVQVGASRLYLHWHNSPDEDPDYIFDGPSDDVLYWLGLIDGEALGDLSAS
jgi:hypothetical protein